MNTCSDVSLAIALFLPPTAILAPMSNPALPILAPVPAGELQPRPFPSVVERYYSRIAVPAIPRAPAGVPVPPPGPSGDLPLAFCGADYPLRVQPRAQRAPRIREAPMAVLVHHNRLLLPCIAETHPLVLACAADPALGVRSVTVRPDLRAYTPSGKGKKRAPLLRPGDPLATVTLTSGAVFQIPSPIRGFFLEPNFRLAADPNLLLRDPVGDGHLALMRASNDGDRDVFLRLVGRAPLTPAAPDAFALRKACQNIVLNALDVRSPALADPQPGESWAELYPAPAASELGLDTPDTEAPEDDPEQVDSSTAGEKRAHSG
jgi:hypothetical protein